MKISIVAFALVLSVVADQAFAKLLCDETLVDWIGEDDGLGKELQEGDEYNFPSYLPGSDSHPGTNAWYTGDGFISHDIDMSKFQGQQCELKSATIEISTLGQGFFGETDVRVRGHYGRYYKIGELTDGHSFTWREGNSEVVRKDTIHVPDWALAQFEDGEERLLFDTHLRYDKWALDYSKLSLKMHCESACPRKCNEKITSLIGKKNGFGRGIQPDQQTNLSPSKEFGKTNKWLLGDRTFTHHFNALPYANCDVQAASLELFTLGQGDFALSTVKVDGKAVGELTDGQLGRNKIARKDTLDLEDAIFAELGDGRAEVTVDTYLKFDKWALDYSELTIDLRCPEACGGGVDGDPHFKTWVDDKWMDYMGECDLVLLDAPAFEDDKAILIEVRTTIRYEYSYVESAALRIGNDILEVESYGQYALSGIDQADLEGEERTLAGFPIIHTIKSSKHHVFDVILGPSEKITISSFKDLVSVKITGPSEKHFAKSVGIMGSLAGDMLSRNGTKMDISTTDAANAFGQEWQVGEKEPMLFRTARSPQSSRKERCVLPQDASKQSLRRRLEGSKITQPDAEEACATFAGAAFDKCVYDVIAVGDLELAHAVAY